MGSIPGPTTTFHPYAKLCFVLDMLKFTNIYEDYLDALDLIYLAVTPSVPFKRGITVSLKLKILVKGWIKISKFIFNKMKIFLWPSECSDRNIYYLNSINSIYINSNFSTSRSKN